MDKRLEEYQKFIDALVRLSPSKEAHWTRGKAWPRTFENFEINALLADLSDAQLDLLAELLQNTRDGAIHDVLAYLEEEVDCGGMQLSRCDTPLAVDPYGSELYTDWEARKSGKEWPEDQLNREYTDGAE
jgi:hypothetical protein